MTAKGMTSRSLQDAARDALLMRSGKMDYPPLTVNHEYHPFWMAGVDALIAAEAAQPTKTVTEVVGATLTVTQPTRAELVEALREFQQTDVSDARKLAAAIVDNAHHSVTGTEAERIGCLLRTMERNARIARALLSRYDAAGGGK